MYSIVAGGAGFIGSHLCEYLLSKDHQVLCIDSLLTGATENLNNILDNKNFEFVKHDITEPFHSDEKIDFIFNLASPASPVDYHAHPIHTLKVGSVGTYNLLELAMQHNARFLLASTSEVYGDPEITPQKEEYWGHVNSIGPRSVYDEAKRYAEALTMAYNRKHGVKTRIARIFNTYGPRMQLHDGRAVPNFIRQSLCNEPISIYGDGFQTRSFCYISDQINGLYLLMQSDYKLPVNIGNPEERTILDLAKLIADMCSSNPKFVYSDLPVDDPKQRRPDISKAKNILKWEPKVDIKEGLEETIKWCREQL